MTNAIKYGIINTVKKIKSQSEKDRKRLNMAKITEKSTPVQVMNAVREKAFDELVSILSTVYDIGITGDSTLVIKIDEAPTGESVYAEISPKIKNYVYRKTAKTEYFPFDFDKATAGFVKNLADRKAKAEEIAKKKAEKIAKDKARREAKAQEKAEQENADSGESADESAE